MFTTLRPLNKISALDQFLFYGGRCRKKTPLFPTRNVVPLCSWNFLCVYHLSSVMALYRRTYKSTSKLYTLWRFCWAVKQMTSFLHSLSYLGWVKSSCLVFVWLCRLVWDVFSLRGEENLYKDSNSIFFIKIRFIKY